MKIFLEGCVRFKPKLLPVYNTFMKDVYLDDVSQFSIYNVKIDFLSRSEVDGKVEGEVRDT